MQAGYLDRPGGHRIRYACAGATDGLPVLLLHGGPGSGISRSAVRRFDPERWRTIAFDQRGCGQSTPGAGDHDNDLADNTTAHLIDDIEALRCQLGIARWVVFGASWGATLALVYAQRHPATTLGLILAGVTMTRWSEIDWLYNGLQRFLPEAWARFAQAIPAPLRHLHPVDAYRALLNADDPATRQAAADAWHEWEAGSISADPRMGWPERWRDPAYRLARARLCAHYFHHRAWLAEDQLLRDAHRLDGIPGYLIQGRLDLQAPPATAHALARAWPDSECVMIDNAGHSTGDAGMAEAVAQAAGRLLERWDGA
ncbi:prolyl aminopeptidase [Rhizobium halophytocola]|nr:prolyl aminopeptidase [Rhizobium halophytocola]